VDEKNEFPIKGEWLQGLLIGWGSFSSKKEILPLLVVRSFKGLSSRAVLPSLIKKEKYV